MTSTHVRILKRSTALVLPGLLAATTSAFAKGGGEAPIPSTMQNPVIIIMVMIILVLLLAIALLSFVVNGAMDIYRDKMKKPPTAPLVILMLLCSSSLMAQDAVPAVEPIVSGVSNGTIYILATVIGLEMLVLLALLYCLRVLLGMEKQRKVKLVEASVRTDTWFSRLWQKLNQAKPIEEEEDIDLGHDYDGIRELDNRLPPWWLYGFYLCILISVVYMWRFHVSHSGPSSLEEYKYAMETGEQQKLDYLKNAANNIDENTVTYLNDEASITAGREAFITMCAACHGKGGEGGVGPNLTDVYWLHGGSIRDIFKTLKYGWPEKGMRSWQDDYSPKQLAQISSFVKSLKGTNPPNSKDPQGEIFKEDGAVEDSVKLSTPEVESK